MGKELAGNIERSPEQIKGSIDTRTAGAAGAAPAGNGTDRSSRTEPNSAGRPPAPPAPRRSAPAAEGRKAEEKGLPGLASLTPEIPVPAEPQKKKKRTPKKKKQEPQNATAEQISAFLLATSQIIGSREGMQVFTLTPAETMQLATPMANLIEKSEKLQNLGEHADAISLVTASLIIFAPRVLIYSEQQKQKKIQQTGGVKLVDTRKDTEKGKSRKDPGKPNEPRPADVQTDASSIFSAIPVTI